jgi:hypothetical protein
MDTAADAAALRADTAVPPQAPIVILRMSTRPTREPCPIGATLLPNHLEDIMLLSPDRGRGGERGLHSVGFALPMLILRGAARQMERVAEGI